MPHTTQPGTIAMLNFESSPTAPTTSDLFTDLSKIWAASSGKPLPPAPLPLPPPIFPVPGPGPTPAPTPVPGACVRGARAVTGKKDCEERGGTWNAIIGSVLGQCVCPGEAKPGGLEEFGGIIATVIGIILVLIAVALIVR